MNITRQVRRAAERKNDYWSAGTHGPRGLSVPRRARGCQLAGATNRDHISARVIASKQPRTRIAPRPEPRFASHMRHAWQRKAHHAAELRKLLGADASGPAAGSVSHREEPK